MTARTAQQTQFDLEGFGFGDGVNGQQESCTAWSLATKAKPLSTSKPV